LVLNLLNTHLQRLTIRRGILERLRDRESTVSELAQPVAMSLLAVSKHLHLLKEAVVADALKALRKHM
jgi:predicted transcriptional regulator